MNRVFVTGDTHGAYEVSRLNSRNFPEGKQLGADDFVIVVGDFGLPWSYPESGEDKYWLRWLESKPWTTIFVDGNHENFDYLDRLSVEKWHGGRVQRIRPGIIRLMRGELFDIAGLKVFAFGGARSTDRIYRTEHMSWWCQEMPSADERSHGWETLESCGWQVDLVLTHCAPSIFQHAINPTFENDRLTEYLYELERQLDYGRWLFGHYHVDEDLDFANAQALYQRIIEVA